MINWQQIGENDYKAEVDGYLLRIERLRKGTWWFAVTFNGILVDDMWSSESAKTEKSAKALCEKIYLEHKATAL